MKKNSKRLSKQKGFLVVVSVIMIMIVGFIGAVIASMYFSSAMSGANYFKANVALYTADSGLETATRYLLNPVLASRSTCPTLAGNANLTNASFAGTTIPGTFTAQTVSIAGAIGANAAIAANTALTGAMLTTSTIANVTSTASFAPKGRIMIDRELINYTGKTATAFLGLERGAGLSLASSHTTGTQVAQLQCTLDVQAGLPTLATANFQRELQEGVQLQEAWGVGNASGVNFRLTRWNQPTEKTWTLNSIAGGGNQVNLNAVSVTSHGEGWATGNGLTSNYSFLHETSPGNWVQASAAARCNLATKNVLFGISTISSQEAWAVGGSTANGTGGGPNCSGTTRRYSIVQWNGATWTTLAPPTIPADSTANQVLEAAHVIDTTGSGTGNIGFAVGLGGTILKYSGGTWINDAQSKVVTTIDLYSVYVVSMTEAWASGGANNNTGIILKWTGTGGGAGTWSIASSGLPRSLRSIYMRDDTGAGTATSGWAVGLAGRNHSYDGTSWTAQANTGNNNLYAVISYAANDTWAGGAGNTTTSNLNHWDGTSWSSVDSGMTTDINGLSAIAPSRFPFSGWNEVVP